MENNIVSKGQIKFFREEVGYGFITGDDKIDTFFHISEFSAGVVPLKGQSVQYEIIATNKGPKAVKCSLI